jgi:HEAT repeat protein
VKALAEIEDRRGDATLTLARQDRDRIVRRSAAEALEDRHEHDDD